MYQLKNNRTEWKIRYEIALDIAKQEYLLQIERIKNLDEKIEKFLIVAAAFIAALVAILGNISIVLFIVFAFPELTRIWPFFALSQLVGRHGFLF